MTFDPNSNYTSLKGQMALDCLAGWNNVLTWRKPCPGYLEKMWESDARNYEGAGAVVDRTEEASAFHFGFSNFKNPENICVFVVDHYFKEKKVTIIKTSLALFELKHTCREIDEICSSGCTELSNHYNLTIRGKTLEMQPFTITIYFPMDSEDHGKTWFIGQKITNVEL